MSDGGGQASRWLEARWAIDAVIAVVALVVTSPIMFGLAMAIRFTSPGGSIVGLRRIGRRGEPFTMWKLRSMRAAAPDGRAGGNTLTLTNDDRITPVGRFMRRVRVDELPQLVNILRGEMAIIGPRPETPEFVDLDDPLWPPALLARPGIAGPTQVMVHDWEAELADLDFYRDEILPVKLAIDAWYIANASPMIDLLVVVALAQSLLGGKSETILHRRVRRAVPEAARIPVAS